MACWNNCIQDRGVGETRESEPSFCPKQLGERRHHLLRQGGRTGLWRCIADQEVGIKEYKFRMINRCPSRDSEEKARYVI